VYTFIVVDFKLIPNIFKEEEEGKGEVE